jgi:hypothetical protein
LGLSLTALACSAPKLVSVLLTVMGIALHLHGGRITMARAIATEATATATPLIGCRPAAQWRLARSRPQVGRPPRRTSENGDLARDRTREAALLPVA